MSRRTEKGTKQMTSQAQQLEMVLALLHQVDVDGLRTMERTVQRLLQQRTAA
jgi:hypothetical protein